MKTWLHYVHNLLALIVMNMLLNQVVQNCNLAELYEVFSFHNRITLLFYIHI